MPRAAHMKPVPGAEKQQPVPNRINTVTTTTATTTTTTNFIYT